MGSQVGTFILQATDLEFHEKFMDGGQNFTASDRWIDRWKGGLINGRRSTV